MNNRRRAPQKNPNAKNSKTSPKRHSRNSKRRNHHQKLSGFEKVEKSYYNLLEKHLEARKKYFDLFHRADPNQLRKLEKSFSNTLYELRNYIDGLDEKLQEKFNNKFNSFKEDHTYSLNHGINPDAEHIPHAGQFEDPHLLETQQADFSRDTEESIGSIEDYRRYKGV